MKDDTAEAACTGVQPVDSAKSHSGGQATWSSGAKGRGKAASQDGSKQSSGQKRKREVMRWTAHEEEQLRHAVDKYGDDAWGDVASMLQARLCSRTSRQCREHYREVISPDVKHEHWTSEEELQLASLHAHLGPTWTRICQRMPGRPANACKNKFNGTMRRKDAEDSVLAVYIAYLHVSDELQVDSPTRLRALMYANSFYHSRKRQATGGAASASVWAPPAAAGQAPAGIKPAAAGAAAPEVQTIHGRGWVSEAARPAAVAVVATSRPSLGSGASVASVARRPSSPLAGVTPDEDDAGAAAVGQSPWASMGPWQHAAPPARCPSPGAYTQPPGDVFGAAATPHGAPHPFDIPHGYAPSGGPEGPHYDRMFALHAMDVLSDMGMTMASRGEPYYGGYSGLAEQLQRQSAASDHCHGPGAAPCPGMPPAGHMHSDTPSYMTCASVPAMAAPAQRWTPPPHWGPDGTTADGGGAYDGAGLPDTRLRREPRSVVAQDVLDGGSRAVVGPGGRPGASWPAHDGYMYSVDRQGMGAAYACHARGGAPWPVREYGGAQQQQQQQRAFGGYQGPHGGWSGAGPPDGSQCWPPAPAEARPPWDGACYGRQRGFGGPGPRAGVAHPRYALPGSGHRDAGRGSVACLPASSVASGQDPFRLNSLDVAFAGIPEESRSLSTQ